MIYYQDFMGISMINCVSLVLFKAYMLRVTYIRFKLRIKIVNQLADE